jgi:hypothetical protein
MSNEVLTFDHGAIRRTDSNSLLRLYDRATGVFNKSKSHQEQVTAERIMRRIPKGLEKRKVTLCSGC